MARERALAPGVRRRHAWPKRASPRELQLRIAAGTAPWLADDEEFQRERKATWYAFYETWHELRGMLEKIPILAVALGEQRAKSEYWRVLGFSSRADFDEYLQPTMKTLTSSPGDLAEHVLERLLAGPLVMRDLEDEEEIPKEITVELFNRLLADKWASLERAGDDYGIRLTPAGQSLLPKRLAQWRRQREG